MKVARALARHNKKRNAKNEWWRATQNHTHKKRLPRFFLLPPCQTPSLCRWPTYHCLFGCRLNFPASYNEIPCRDDATLDAGAAGYHRLDLQNDGCFLPSSTSVTAPSPLRLLVLLPACSTTTTRRSQECERDLTRKRGRIPRQSQHNLARQWGEPGGTLVLM